jgi:hypothetical protein
LDDFLHALPINDEQRVGKVVEVVHIHIFVMVALIKIHSTFSEGLMLETSTIVPFLFTCLGTFAYLVVKDGEGACNPSFSNHHVSLCVSSISRLIRMMDLEIVPIVFPLNSTTQPPLIART